MATTYVSTDGGEIQVIGNRDSGKPGLVPDRGHLRGVHRIDCEPTGKASPEIGGSRLSVDVWVVVKLGAGTKRGICSGELLSIDASETHFVKVPITHGEGHCSYLCGSKSQILINGLSPADYV